MLVFNNLTYVPIDIDMIDFKMLSPFEKNICLIII